MTNWKYSLFILVRRNDVTTQLRNAYGRAFAEEGSGESADDEAKAFDSAIKLVQPSDPNTVVAGLIATPAKLSMRPRIKALIDAVPNSHFIATARVAFDGHTQDEVVANNLPGVNVGDVMPLSYILATIETRLGLIQQPQEVES